MPNKMKKNLKDMNDLYDPDKPQVYRGHFVSIICFSMQKWTYLRFVMVI